MNTCMHIMENIINLYKDRVKAHKIQEVHETLTRRISHLEDAFKVLLRIYDVYIIDHDSIYSGGNENE